MMHPAILLTLFKRVKRIFLYVLSRIARINMFIYIYIYIWSQKEYKSYNISGRYYCFHSESLKNRSRNSLRTQVIANAPTLVDSFLQTISRKVTPMLLYETVADPDL